MAIQRRLDLNGHYTRIRSFKQREKVMTTLKRRFSTYGFEQIETPTYEAYDLYTNIQGTVHRDDMVKTIDRTGEVLVIRPDVTIPIMQKVAMETVPSDIELRYFYVLNVFRHSFGSGYDQERTQAGVELFGNDSIEADAEIIALAIQSLRDLTFEDFTIELGHAGFFKELVDDLQLTSQQMDELKRLIQTKNVIELEPFLSRLQIDEPLNQAIQTIPLLYGHPKNVFERAQQIIFNEQMKLKMQRLINIYALLEAYGVEKYVVIDLGLINHMNYYSGIIFQGFVDTIGKPVLMGGRYDQLARQFQASTPAIGFATDIDVLQTGIPMEVRAEQVIDVAIFYTDDQLTQGITLANVLRTKGYRVLIWPINRKSSRVHPTYMIHMSAQNIEVVYDDHTYDFQTIDDVNNFLDQKEEK